MDNILIHSRTLKSEKPFVAINDNYSLKSTSKRLLRKNKGCQYEFVDLVSDLLEDNSYSSSDEGKSYENYKNNKFVSDTSEENNEGLEGKARKSYKRHQNIVKHENDTEKGQSKKEKLRRKTRVITRIKSIKMPTIDDYHDKESSKEENVKKHKNISKVPSFGRKLSIDPEVFLDLQENSFSNTLPLSFETYENLTPGKRMEYLPLSLINRNKNPIMNQERKLSETETINTVYSTDRLLDVIPKKSMIFNRIGPTGETVTIKLNYISDLSSDDIINLLIPQDANKSSWKDGFNSGLEFGKAQGFVDGEDFGIEEGKLAGYIQAMHELEKKTNPQKTPEVSE